MLISKYLESNQQSYSHLGPVMQAKDADAEDLVAINDLEIDSSSS